MIEIRPIIVVLMSTALIATAFVAPVTASSHRTYEVTIVNRPDRGQPMTPPLIATHSSEVNLFEVGAAANLGTQEIAENGNLAPMLAHLAMEPNVSAVVAAAAPLAPRRAPSFGTFSDRVTLTITAAPGADFLSWESMLICTNDGFTGVDSLPLPIGVGDTVSVLTAAYDAGTEVNTEDFADIVPPCQALAGVSSGEPGSGMTNVLLSEGGVIHHHAGVDGDVDLVRKIHDWNRWVGHVIVRRVG
ncbi:MAG: spondin domain-containing protein [Chloroflexota bacterium]